MAFGALIRRLAALGVALGFVSACAATPLPLRQALSGFAPKSAPAPGMALPETLYALKPLPDFVTVRALYEPTGPTLSVFTKEGGYCLRLGALPEARPEPLGECQPTDAPAPPSAEIRTSR